MKLRAYGFKEIFHPDCKHHVFPVRNWESLPPQNIELFELLPPTEVVDSCEHQTNVQLS
ncbi:hypothetical protein SAMN05444392_12415 [Seinonella peptonophila]|uniref:Uncharacterized protein n=1 Tax=Seinonella peptonophila TaxID=112248 RepID=A0A1M5BIX0_9BACL|nr:hypothetical protein SAMN05444392_12415 [Seinonella peptonophila]